MNLNLKRVASAASIAAGVAASTLLFGIGPVAAAPMPNPSPAPTTAPAPGGAHLPAEPNSGAEPHSGPFAPSRRKGSGLVAALWPAGDSCHPERFRPQSIPQEVHDDL